MFAARRTGARAVPRPDARLTFSYLKFAVGRRLSNSAPGVFYVAFVRPDMATRESTADRLRSLACKVGPALAVFGLAAFVALVAWPLDGGSALLLATLVATGALGVLGLARPELTDQWWYATAVGLAFVGLGASLLLAMPVAEATAPAAPEWLFVIIGGAVAIQESGLGARVGALAPAALDRAAAVSALFAGAGLLLMWEVLADALATGYDAVTAVGLLGGGGILLLIARDYLRGSPEARAMATDDEGYYLLLAFSLWGLLSLVASVV